MDTQQEIVQISECKTWHEIILCFVFEYSGLLSSFLRISASMTLKKVVKSIAICSHGILQLY